MYLIHFSNHEPTLVKCHFHNYCFYILPHVLQRIFPFHQSQLLYITSSLRKKNTTEKERTSHWNKEIKTVRKIETELGQTYYFLDGDTVGYLRHELLKV